MRRFALFLLACDLFSPVPFLTPLSVDYSLRYPKHMLKYVWLLICCPLGIAAQIPAEEIYRYEKEDVSRFRDRTTFELPEPTVIIQAEPQEGGSLSPSSLSPLFSDTQKVYIDADPNLEAWINVDKAQKNRITEVQGYRIQVYAGTSRQRAFQYKGNLVARFPELESYLDFTSPNYVVRVGDFMGRDEAELYLKRIRQYLATAFIVPAKVKVPKYDPEWEEKYDARQNEAIDTWDDR